MSKAQVQKIELSLLTLNTMGAPFKRRLEERYLKIVDAIRQSSAGFFALQETFHRAQTRRLILDPLEAENFFSVHAHASSLRKFKTSGSGLASVSRHPILKSEFHKFTAARSVDRLANKGVLFTRLELGPQLHVDIYNTHLQASYFYRNQNAKTRLRQLLELFEFVKTHSPPENLVVVLGDFNFKETTREYRYFIDDLGRSHDYHFVEVMRTLCPSAAQHPLYTFQMSRNKACVEKIDHKFLHTGKNWVWNQAESETEILDWNVSDHFPVFTKLVFESAGPVS